MKLRGVNLGGWLVLERWMTPSVFEGTDAKDEWTFMQTDNAAEKLNRHREEFITESDFAWIADNRFNAVRLPVGYWIIQPDGPYIEGIAFVDWAFAVAEKYKLKVLLDLHGVPESQNGHDHSGKVGQAGWFSDTEAQQRTLDILTTLHERYRDSPSYWGLQVINEPRIGVFHWTLRRFYREASRRIKGSQHIVFHDAFTPRLMSGVLGGDRRAVMDVHLYHMTSLLARFISARQFVSLCRWMYGTMLRQVSRKQSVIIGEWSIVLKGDKLSGIPEEEQRRLMQEFCEIQLETYEQHALGWFYWSYKTESPDIWNLRSLVEDGTFHIPQ
jgi:glucan 1,3-beta-glucosidase